MAKNIAYKLEYTVRSSPQILFEFLSTASGLQEWFADEVRISGNSLVFYWEGSPEKADIMELVENEFIRLHWEDSPENEYFEFRVGKSEVTNDTILTITDFAEKDEVEDQERLWDSQLQELFTRIGA